LLSLDFLDGVHVSTEDAEIAEVSASFGATTLHLRAADLAADTPGFIDLIREDLPRFCEEHGGDTEVLFVLATAALIPAHLYREAHNIFRRARPDILMSCERYSSSPFWALTQKPDGYWTAEFPDKVMINSQDLPDTFADAGLWYFFDLNDMLKYQSVKLADKLLPFVVAEEYACDVDTIADWLVLEKKFARLRTGGPPE